MTEMMKESNESHQKEMKSLYEKINESRQESIKIMEGIRKAQKERIEKYEEEKKENERKKELKQIEANNQLINETNLSKDSILKEYEEEFDKMKNIYCFEEIDNMDISNDIEDLFYNNFDKVIEDKDIEMIR